MSSPMKPGSKILLCLPIPYSDDGSFWSRDLGLSALTLREAGMDARLVTLDNPAITRACPMGPEASIGAGSRVKKRGHEQRKMLPCPKSGVYISVCDIKNKHTDEQDPAIPRVIPSSNSSDFW